MGFAHTLRLTGLMTLKHHTGRFALRFAGMLSFSSFLLFTAAGLQALFMRYFFKLSSGLCMF
jgi:hypothetical protein